MKRHVILIGFPPVSGRKVQLLPSGRMMFIMNPAVSEARIDVTGHGHFTGARSKDSRIEVGASLDWRFPSIKNLELAD
jgi:hypothetical protein